MKSWIILLVSLSVSVNLLYYSGKKDSEPEKKDTVLNKNDVQLIDTAKISQTTQEIHCKLDDIEQILQEIAAKKKLQANK